VGRHAAADGASAHPLVAEALAYRPVDAAGAHRGDDAQPDDDARRDDERPGREGDPGWPGPPPSPGGGLGWPGDTTDGAGADGGSFAEPSPPVARRGWRRFFGVTPAA
jgi:hypothetical protein